MTRTAIISVDGHVKASLKGYRGYVDPGLRERYDEYVSAMEEAGTWDATTVIFSADHPFRHRPELDGRQIGRASCRERV